MVSKILFAVGLFAACLSYCTSAIVYVQKSYPEPKGRCQTLNCIPSIHANDVHTYDCHERYIVNNQVVENEFYLKRRNGTSPDEYNVVTLDGSLTGNRATLKLKDNITVYKERSESGTVLRILCATNTRVPDTNTQTNVNKHCKGKNMKDNDNTGC